MQPLPEFSPVSCPGKALCAHGHAERAGALGKALCRLSERAPGIPTVQAGKGLSPERGDGPVLAPALPAAPLRWRTDTGRTTVDARHTQRGTGTWQLFPESQCEASPGNSRSAHAISHTVLRAREHALVTPTRRHWTMPSPDLSDPVAAGRLPSPFPGSPAARAGSARSGMVQACLRRGTSTDYLSRPTHQAT